MATKCNGPGLFAVFEALLALYLATNNAGVKRALARAQAQRCRPHCTDCMIRSEVLHAAWPRQRSYSSGTAPKKPAEGQRTFPASGFDKRAFNSDTSVSGLYDCREIGLGQEACQGPAVSSPNLCCIGRSTELQATRHKRPTVEARAARVTSRQNTSVIAASSRHHDCLTEIHSKSIRSET